MQDLFLGIDPGLSGAFAIIDSTHSVLLCDNLPVMLITKEGLTSSSIVTKHIDALKLWQLLAPFKARLASATIERIVTLPAINKTACLSLGDSYGSCRSVCQMLEIPKLHCPTPAFWKKKVGVTAPKGTSAKDKKALSKDKVVELFGAMPARFRHDKAEAVLLAEFSRIMYSTTA